MKIISGTSNPELSTAIARQCGINLADAAIQRFADQEVFVEIKEHVRGEDVFIIQPTSFPANDHIMELLVCLDALKRASPRRITAVIPYFGYARQDRKPGPRTPISAKLVADIITSAGAHRVLTVDLHAAQIQGFFNIPVDNLYARPVFEVDIKENYKNTDIIIVSPDVGGVVRARSLAKRLDAELAIVDKRREHAGHSEVMHIIGEVKNKHCILIDDIVDSAGTLCNSAQALMENGAIGVSAYVTHGVFSGKALDRINNSVMQELVITDTINQHANVASCPKIRIVSIAPLMAEAIVRISRETSVSSLFGE